MRIKRIFLKDYKNLKNFNITFDDKQKNVLLGVNASGKSNFLEAIVLIFKQLHLDEDPELDFSIEYNLEHKLDDNDKIEYNLEDKDKINYNIFIQGNKSESPNKKYVFYLIKDGDFTTTLINEKASFDTIWEKVENNQTINGNMSRADFTAKYKYKLENLSKKSPVTPINPYLPKRIFTYYSGLGNSNRLEPLFDRTEHIYNQKLIRGNLNTIEDVPARPLFYVKLHHYYFVLLAFYAFDDDTTHSFLKKHLNIEGIGSILFVLKEPYYAKNIKNKNDKFWGARGIVREFLEELWKISFAPIKRTEKVRIGVSRETHKEKLYLFLPKIESLKSFIERSKWKPIDFFNVLDSINASDLRDNIIIRVRKKFANVAFKNLSEGEQQLLTVLGLMRFTSDENSLFLLDEPDTHLNPLWKWHYMSFMDEIANTSKNSQVIMTTHDPLTIGSLTKEEVRVFYTNEETGQIQTYTPEEDPKGMGVEGILTSPMFGLPTVLDIPTRDKLNRKEELYNRKYYSNEKLSPKDESEYQTLATELDDLGIQSVNLDPIYQKLLIAYKQHFKNDAERQKAFTPEEIEERNQKALEILNSILDEENP